MRKETNHFTLTPRNIHITLFAIVFIILLVLAFVFERENSEHAGFLTFKQGTFITTAIIFLAIHFAISSLIFLWQPKFLVLTHVVSVILASAIMVVGFLIMAKVRETTQNKQALERQQTRRLRSNVIQLKKWWYIHNDKNVKEVHAIVSVSESGRFAASGYGLGTDSFRQEINVFSLDMPEQRKVNAGDEFEVVLVADYFQTGDALEGIALHFHLMKLSLGPSTDDVSKIYRSKIKTKDDGHFYYEVLPAPSESASD